MCEPVESKAVAGILEHMAKSAPHRSPAPSPVIRKLAEQGRLKPPLRRLRDVLAERGPLRGPVSDAGSRAVQEQRGDGG